MSELKLQSYNFIDAPEYSGWKCELFGLGEHVLCVYPLKGQVPNWFWRKMQYLILGNKWVKIK